MLLRKSVAAIGAHYLAGVAPKQCDKMSQGLRAAWLLYCAHLVKSGFASFMPHSLSRLGNRFLLTLVLVWLSATVAAKDVQVRPAPACQLMDWSSGQALNWQALRGKVVYVDFWASWCTSCVQSFPFLDAMAKDLREQGLAVVGVNLDEDRAEAANFLAKHPVGFTVVTDAANSCPQAFGVEGMPAAYLIDRMGNIRYQHLGFRRDQSAQLRQQVEQLLREPL